MPEVILPCPDCGGECIAVREPTIDLNEWRMHCFCGYAGRYCASEEEAIKAHNALPRMSAIIAWQLQAAGAALENQRLRAVLKSVEKIVLEAPELNMSNFDEDQIYSINEAMISICGILLQESARNDLEARHG